MVVLIRTALILMLLLAPGIPASAADKAPDTVVILHGIARTGKSMSAVESFLQQEGYETLAITYPSTRKDIDHIATGLDEKELDSAFWSRAGKVHFVTHSMGGLVARRYLEKFRSEIPPEKLGRIVMLAPPNAGSEVADTLHGLWPYQWYYGPAGQELTTRAQAGNKSDIWYDLGIIAGTKEWPYIVAAFVVPGPGDGRVSVERTRLEGMKDHMTVNATHTYIMDRSDVHRQIVHFLEEGAFGHEE